MVAATASLRLESTSNVCSSIVHGGRKPKMALNFTVSPRQLIHNGVSPPNGSTTNNSPNKNSLSAPSNEHHRLQPSLSPGMAAIRKINEVLALSSSSPSSTVTAALANDSSSVDENSAQANEASAQRADALKSQLIHAIDKEDFVEVKRVIEEIETAHLTKNALESSRIAAVVNTLRKQISSTHADISRKCRALIKSWRSNVDALVYSSRPGSSCGSSSGTPNMVSPSIRRVVGRNTTPNSPLLTVHEAPPAKRAKISPTVTPPQTISVIEARRNVQSTDQLIAALGMQNFLSSSTNSAETKVEAVSMQMTTTTNNIIKSEAGIQITSSTTTKTIERRARKRREPSNALESELQVPRIKIRFGGMSAEEHDVENARITADNNAAEHQNGLADSAAPSTSAASAQSASKKSAKKAKSASKSSFSWYAKLPSVEELEMRTQNPQPLVDVQRSESPTDPAAWKYRERTVLLMPYLDTNNEPDFLRYDFPDKERYTARKRAF